MALSEGLIVFVTPLKDFLDENRIASEHLDASEHYAGGVVVIRGYRSGQYDSPLACLPASAHPRDRRRSSTQHSDKTLTTLSEEANEQVRTMGVVVGVWVSAEVGVMASVRLVGAPAVVWRTRTQKNDGNREITQWGGTGCADGYCCSCVICVPRRSTTRRRRS